MIRSSSFRHRLAIRIALTVSALLFVASALVYTALRSFLYRRLDGTVLRLAQIEAAATSDSPDESVHFHDDVFLGGGAGHEAILTRYAQVWTLDGAPVVRTRNLGSADLPLAPEVRQRVVATGEPELFSLTWRGGTYRAVLYPLGLLGPTHALHLLQVAAATQETDTLLRQVVAVLAALVVGGFAAGGAVGWWLSGYAVRPVLEIIREAEAFEIAAPGHHITAHADTEEHRRLLAVLNAMLHRVDEALEGQRRFVADAGHAIKTPLTMLRGDLDVTLRRDRPAEEYRQALMQALSDLKEVSALADHLITLARADGGALDVEPSVVSLGALLSRVARRYEGAVRRAGMTVAVEEGGKVDAAVDPVLLERAVGDLVDNAVKYGRPGGHIRLSALSDGETREIRVIDDGPGLEPEELARVRERFYRGDRARGTVAGTGLGLAIVDAVAQAHGGRLELTANPDGGVTATLRLPGGAMPSIGGRGAAGHQPTRGGFEAARVSPLEQPGIDGDDHR